MKVLPGQSNWTFERIGPLQGQALFTLRRQSLWFELIGRRRRRRTVERNVVVDDGDVTNSCDVIDDGDAFLVDVVWWWWRHDCAAQVRIWQRLEGMVWRLLHFRRHCSKKKSKLFGFGFFSYNSKIDWFFTTTFVRRWSLAVDSKCGIS